MTTVRIPTPLRRFTKGAEEVSATGATVAEVINDLDRNYAGMKKRLCEDDGKVRRFVNIYVNDEDIRFLKSLETPVSEGDEVSILPAIAGGNAGIRRSRWGQSQKTEQSPAVAGG
ncbi:MAG: MoaD/ThiS family protein [Candidatus Abyssobacteria bacterium SURF_17]|uniref:MoaD/ThiS family protein n=1 Tax=Candidatus Abyssobacteria bacterium SURF_17 TaxID=2093361 RepID=A0A419F954_9BACT|nr:MAG: MoaD/ThiS family protein [Candidatus Abyssubacteria bacterium SURF_17]